MLRSTIEAKRLRHELRDKVKEQLSHYKGIDPTKLGTLLGQGNEHYVFEYKEFEQTTGWVIKVPKLTDATRPGKIWDTPQQVEDSYKMLRQYFGNAIPYTRVFPSNTSEHDYCMVQREIPNAKHLTVNMLLENPTLAEQFYQIIWANYNLKEETKKYLPLLGREGTLSTIKGKPLLTNIVVEGKGNSAKLRIIDFGLLNNDPLTKELPPKTQPTRSELATWIQGIDKQLGNLLTEHLPPHLLEQGKQLIKNQELTREQLEKFLVTHAMATLDGACILANDLVIELFFLRLLDKHFTSFAANRRRIWNRWNPLKR